MLIADVWLSTLDFRLSALAPILRRFGSKNHVAFSRTGGTVWLAQQWNPGIRFALLDEPAVAPNMAIQH